jgi:hypothetical protein
MAPKDHTISELRPWAIEPHSFVQRQTLADSEAEPCGPHSAQTRSRARAERNCGEKLMNFAVQLPPDRRFRYTTAMNTYPLTQSLVRFVTPIVTLALLFGLTTSQSAADQPAERAAALFNGKNLEGWKLRNEKLDQTWKVVTKVELDKADAKKLVGTGTGGTRDAVLFRAPVEHGSDILTEKSFGDCELHLELMVAKGSNSGVYLMGQYEVQVFDSFGKPNDQISHADMGGIYSVQAPSTNASKAPGEWQTLDILFRAPRFDAAGKKTENAKFVSVTLNGKKIQENLEVKGPTGGELSDTEKPTGPLMLQGDHGVVAYRNITIKTGK